MSEREPNTYAELRRLSDDELVELYDLQAGTMTKAGGFYVDELARRDRNRSVTLVLMIAVASAILAGAAVAVALLDYVRT